MLDNTDPYWWLHLEKPEVQKVLASTGLTKEQYAKYLLDEVYEEPPVSMREFLFSPDYANFAGDLWPNVQAILEEFDKPEYREADLAVGRGSGKSALAAIFLARQLYNVLNFKDPWKFFQLRKNTPLTVLNVSVSGANAQGIIFDNLTQIVENSKYFKGKFSKRTSLGHADLYFPSRNLRAISGHSGSSVWRGYAIYSAVMDEASWMVSKNNKDNAEEIYDVLKGSMQTRFSGVYKLLVISSLKSRNDFVCKAVTALRKQAKEQTGGIETIEVLKQELGIEDWD